MSRRLMARLCLLAAAIAAVPAFAQDVLIRNATVHTASAQGTLKNADVLVRNGVIQSVGTGLAAPAGAEASNRAGSPPRNEPTYDPIIATESAWPPALEARARRAPAEPRMPQRARRPSPSASESEGKRTVRRPLPSHASRSVSSISSARSAVPRSPCARPRR